MSKRWMIYGANGYTGKLIVELATSKGMSPVLAGRNESKVKAMAETYSLSALSFSLDNPQAIVNALKDVDLLLNCAGPFSKTAEVMMNACIDTNTHYLDITGEIAVFELAQSLSESAKSANITLCPGVGFDVVPTDCLAAKLANSLPGASHLQLGFDTRSGLSPGTAKTSVEGLGQGGKVRKDGVIQPVPLAYQSKKINFGDGEKFAMTIPWGDVSTAFYSTQIPNIEVYVPASPGLVKRLKKVNKIRWLLNWQWVIKLIQYRIGKKVKGPNEHLRTKHRMYVWGQVSNDKNETIEARVNVPNGYSLTADAAVAISQHLLENSVSPGHQTPSLLMGADFLWSLSDVSSLELKRLQPEDSNTQ